LQEELLLSHDYIRQRIRLT